MLHIRVIAILMVFSFCSAYSQKNKLDEKLNISLKNAHPIKVINAINKETGLNLAFESSLLNTENTLSFDGSEKTLRNILDQLFSNTPINFTIVADQIIAVKKSPKDKPIKAQASKANMDYIKKKAKAEQFDKIETIKIHKILFNQESFLVTKDTLLKADSPDGNQIIIYHYEPGDYTSFIESKKLNLDHIAYWGKTTADNNIKLDTKTQANLYKKKNELRAAGKIKRRKHHKINYNAFVRLEQRKRFQMGPDLSYSRMINQSTNFGDFNLKYSDKNSGFRFNLKYSLNNFFVTTGFGVQNIHATITDNRFFEFSDTLSTTQIPHTRTETIDEYYITSENGIVTYVPVTQEITEFETIYDINNYAKQLYEQNQYDTQYLQIPLSLGYSFKLTRQLRFDTYAQTCYTFESHKTAFINIENGFGITNRLFKKHFFSYNLGAQIEVKLGNYLCLYAFGQYNNANLLDNLSINNKMFDTSSYCVGIGTCFNIEWYAAPTKHRYHIMLNY